MHALIDFLMALQTKEEFKHTRHKRSEKITESNTPKEHVMYQLMRVRMEYVEASP